MLGLIAVVMISGVAAVAFGGSDGDDAAELGDTGMPAPDELDDEGMPDPDELEPVAEPTPMPPPPNYQVLKTAAAFGPVQEAIEGTGGEPSTLYVGMSANWQGRLQTVEELVELARSKPALEVKVFAFETTQEMFGLPDSYLSYVAVSVAPSGKVFPTVRQSDRRSDGPLPSAELAELAAFALEGFDLPAGAELTTKKKPGDVDHTIAIWPEGGVIRWAFWRGPAAMMARARGRGQAATRISAMANARAAVVAYKLGHGAGAGFSV